MKVLKATKEANDELKRRRADETAAYKEMELAKIEIKRQQLNIEIEKEKALGSSETRKLRKDLHISNSEREIYKHQMEVLTAAVTRTSLGLERVERAVTKIKKVLIVDDSLETRQVLTRLLKQVEYEIDTAATIKEAIEKLNEGFDWVILDIILEDGNGFRVLEYIRKTGILVRVIICSAVDERNENFQVELSKWRPDWILSKPIQFEALLMLLKDPSVPQVFAHGAPISDTSLKVEVVKVPILDHSPEAIEEFLTPKESPQ